MSDTYYRFGNPCMRVSGYTLIRQDGQWVVHPTRKEAEKWALVAQFNTGCRGIEIWSNRTRKLVWSKQWYSNT